MKPATTLKPRGLSMGPIYTPSWGESVSQILL